MKFFWCLFILGILFEPIIKKFCEFPISKIIMGLSVFGLGYVHFISDKSNIPKNIIIRIIVFIIYFNFILFFSTSIMLGGSAGNGKIENNKYYIGEHGKYIEVTQESYNILKIYEDGTILSVILFGIFSVCHYFDKKSRNKLKKNLDNKNQETNKYIIIK